VAEASTPEIVRATSPVSVPAATTSSDTPTGYTPQFKINVSVVN
jgi:hypothetical protein